MNVKFKRCVPAVARCKGSLHFEGGKKQKSTFQGGYLSIIRLEKHGLTAD